MKNKLFLYAQYLTPQRLLTNIAGILAESQTPWFKNFLIKQFTKRYQVNMAEANNTNALAYTSFNDFFTRKLKPAFRPIAKAPNAIASPVDGCVSQIGSIQKQQLVQAKGFNYDLSSLLADDKALTETFTGGMFATLYLAPHDYHRVHMPIDGKLIQSIYVPGKLFSVNRLTAENIPNIFSRNERLICIFDTAIGHMAVIFVGAMIVGNIQPIWMQHAIRSENITINTHSQTFQKGDELGLFKLGSTVILLFEKNKMTWNNALNEQTIIKMGQLIGEQHA